jgi:hypothetical protein
MGMGRRNTFRYLSYDDVANSRLSQQVVLNLSERPVFPKLLYRRLSACVVAPWYGSAGEAKRQKGQNDNPQRSHFGQGDTASVTRQCSALWCHGSKHNQRVGQTAHDQPEKQASVTSSNGVSD